jgi:RHS repeat-associated protein
VQFQLFPQGQYQSGAAYFYTRDHLGSIREMTNTSGTVVARYDYDPYGRFTTVIGTNKPDFNFTGLYQHAKSGLDMAVYRFYDPDLGRWISRDPIGENGGINLFGYVENNSINLWDPDGLDPQSVGGGWNRFVVNPSNFHELTVASFFHNQLEGNYVTHSNKLASGQCAAGAQYGTGVYGDDGRFYDAPSTPTWRKGNSVGSSTPAGTMIARGWRSDGTYHNGDPGIHTGIYGGRDGFGDFMYDQNNPGTFKKQYIDPNSYNEVLSKNASDSCPTKCGIGPTR